MKKLFVSVLCITLASACTSDGDSDPESQGEDGGATADDDSGDDDTGDDDAADDDTGDDDAADDDAADDDAADDDMGDDDAADDDAADDDVADDDAGADDDTGDDDVPVDPTAPGESAVFGHVQDGAGTPLAGVTVRVGSSTTTTDANGDYAVASATGSVQALFEADGFIPSQRQVQVLEGRPSAAHAVLVAEAPAVEMDAEMGGMVSGDRGALVVVPPAALVDEDGQPVTGPVDVHLTPIDPSLPEEIGAVSGAFLAVGEDGDTLLESLGMVDITIRQGGQKLQVADGEVLQLAIPVPEGSDPPATIPLWSFDEALGRWVEEGEATYDADAGVYFAEASHMSAWNCDQVASATCIMGCVVDEEGNPLAGSNVSGRGLDYFGTSDTVTGEDGCFHLAVRKDSQISVLAEHQFGGGQVREVESGSEDTEVPPVPGPACLDVGLWQVERDVVVLDDGTEVACDEASIEGSGFAGTCAEDMSNVFVCYSPEGACTYHVMANPVRIEYENGSAIEFVSQDSGTGTATYYGPEGQLCGTAEVGADGVSRITDADGNTYAYETADNGDLVVTCPDGETVTLTATEQQILDACTTSEDTMTDGTGQQCQVEGIEGQCAVDTDCTDGMVCCVISPEIGFTQCIDQATCDLVMGM